MGVVLVPRFARYFDFDKALFRATAWYVFGILFLSFFLYELGISVWSFFYLFLCFIALWFPLLHFALWWQGNGRPFMPQTPFSKLATTFYEFTPRYSFVKLLEILFQDLCAILFIRLLFNVTESTVLTTVIFSGLFLIVHAFAFKFYDRFWAWLIFGAIGITIFATPVVLYLDIGYSLLFISHIASYVLFLLFMRRQRMAQLAT